MHQFEYCESQFFQSILFVMSLQPQFLKSTLHYLNNMTFSDQKRVLVLIPKYLNALMAVYDTKLFSRIYLVLT